MIAVDPDLARLLRMALDEVDTLRVALFQAERDGQLQPDLVTYRRYILRVKLALTELDKRIAARASHER